MAESIAELINIAQYEGFEYLKELIK